MPGKIFINYRRDDDPNGAARVRDGLAAKFGKSTVFMDVDNLLAGQRFDEELAKALAQCDVLIAIMGPRWLELLRARAASGERDYVREEIAEALARKLTVIPVRVGRDGQIPALPRRDDLPEDIRDLVLYQKHDVAHERFGRDIAELIEAITIIRRRGLPPYASSRRMWGWISAAAASVLAIGYVGAGYGGISLPWPNAALKGGSPTDPRAVDVAARSKSEVEANARAAEAERLRAAAAKAEDDRKRSEAEATQLRAETEAHRKADEDARAKAIAEAEAKRKAGEAERQRMAALKVDEDRQRATAEAKRKAEEEAARGLPQPGQVFRDCNNGCPEMVVVPAGRFTRGSNEGKSDQKPARVMLIRQPFAVGRFEVTFAEWEACVAGGGCTTNRNPSDQGWGKGRRPVINVSWDDAQQYVHWLSRTTGHVYRLLTEAEWEYAARARGGGKWTFGDDELRLGEFGWYKANSRGRTQPVGGKTANAFGLYDMHGNAVEWVQDCYDYNYYNAPLDGSAAEDIEACFRVIRGGSWAAQPDELRSANRSGNTVGTRNDNLGFRVARTLF